MARNVEIKARVTNFPQLQEDAARLSGTPGETIHQVDVFFNIDQGRLKLRILAPDYGELIYYIRENQRGPKVSQYQRAKTTEPEKMREILKQKYGVRGVVRKVRILHWINNTRIHLDQVEGLGFFMELEVLLEEDQSVAGGLKIADDLMQKLKIQTDDLIEMAYIDMLEIKKEPVLEVS